MKIRNTLIRLPAVMITCLLCAQKAGGQTLSPADDRLDYGSAQLAIPAAEPVNGHTPRTAQLLGSAYGSRGQPVWRRAQYIAELGLVAQPAGMRFIVQAMGDEAALVRAQAARSAALLGESALLEEVESLLTDSEPSVRREAVLAAAQLARTHGSSSSAVEAGLADSDPQVIAAALQAAWTNQQAREIARRLPSLPPELRVEAAQALGRLDALNQAAALDPLLKGDVVHRVAAVRALGQMADHSLAPSVLPLLKDVHPTVRREAVLALGLVAEPDTRDARAIEALSDADPTVREAAARVLTPVPSSSALQALASQLSTDYQPLHTATREALIQPADEPMTAQTISLAAELLTHADARRREDASFILGRLRSDAALEQHIELLRWDRQDPAGTDWLVVAQAAESMGLIGDGRAAELLMVLVQAAPDALAGVQQPQRRTMATAMSNAMIALGRLQHPPALEQAVRLLKLDPEGDSPASLRSAAAFAIGVLAEQGTVPQGISFIGVYESIYEARETKFEALKALGNLRHAPSSQALQRIAENSAAPDLRWIGHWAYQRSTGTEVPYSPPTELRQPPVSISDLAR